MLVSRERDLYGLAALLDYRAGQIVSVKARQRESCLRKFLLCDVLLGDLNIVIGDLIVVDKVKAACCTLRNVACLRCNGRTCDKNEFDACSVDEDLRIIFRNLILSDRNVIDLNTPLQASCSMQKCCELDLCFRRTGCESTV